MPVYYYRWRKPKERPCEGEPILECYTIHGKIRYAVVEDGADYEDHPDNVGWRYIEPPEWWKEER